MAVRYRIPLIIFGAGIIAALLIMQFPKTRGIADLLSDFGYFGAVLGGILYGQSFTAPTATVMFSRTPEAMNALFVAFLGGIGALIYDLGVFLFIRRESHMLFIDTIRQKLSQHRRPPQWILFSLGALILMSPLPDELAAGFFGLTKIDMRAFLAISFVCNAFGILLITLAV